MSNVRRLKGRGHIREHAPGRFRIYAEAPRDPGDPRRRRQTTAIVRGTRDDAEAALDAMLRAFADEADRLSTAYQDAAVQVRQTERMARLDRFLKPTPKPKPKPTPKPEPKAPRPRRTLRTLERRFDASPLLDRLARNHRHANDVTSYAARRIGVDRAAVHRARSAGLSERLADTWAVRAGFHPSEIWPDWNDVQQQPDVQRRRAPAAYDAAMTMTTSTLPIQLPPAIGRCKPTKAATELAKQCADRIVAQLEAVDRDGMGRALPGGTATVAKATWNLVFIYLAYRLVGDDETPIERFARVGMSGIFLELVGFLRDAHYVV